MGQNNLKRGEIYYADLGETKGSVQGGIRPVVILQNNVGNHYSSTTFIVPLTSVKKRSMPTHVILDSSEIDGLPKDSTVLGEQARVIDKGQIKSDHKVAILDEFYTDQILSAVVTNISSLCLTCAAN